MLIVQGVPPLGGVKQWWGGETSYFVAEWAISRKLQKIRPKLLFMTNRKFHMRFRLTRSPAIAEKSARRESMPIIAQIRRAYNVVAERRWQYWSIFIRLAVVASEICEIPRNSLKIPTYGVQGHPRSSILVPVESACVLSYWSLIVTLDVSLTVFDLLTHLARKSLFSHTFLVWRPLAAERHQRNLYIAE